MFFGIIKVADGIEARREVFFFVISRDNDRDSSIFHLYLTTDKPTEKYVTPSGIPHRVRKAELNRASISPQLNIF
jgi:hypothetical protein